MTRSEHFFHGTAHDVAPGGSILPGKTYGKSSFHHGGVGPRGVAHSMSAFATTKEDEAWHFADASFYKHGGRGRIHEVEPHPEMQPGLYNREHPTYKRREARNGPSRTWSEYAAPSFKTTGRTIDIKPGHQGTFPQLNWNQFKGNPNEYGDKNHPLPEEVQHGSLGSRANIESTWAEYNSDHGHPQGHRSLDAPKAVPEHPGQGSLFPEPARNFGSEQAIRRAALGG